MNQRKETWQLSMTTHFNLMDAIFEHTSAQTPWLKEQLNCLIQVCKNVPRDHWRDSFLSKAHLAFVMAFAKNMLEDKSAGAKEKQSRQLIVQATQQSGIKPADNKFKPLKQLDQKTLLSASLAPAKPSRPPQICYRFITSSSSASSSSSSNRSTSAAAPASLQMADRNFRSKPSF